MGIAKSIEAYTIFDDYSDNIDYFLSTLSGKLNVGFDIVILYDNGKEFYVIEERKFIRPQQTEQLALTVSYDEYKINSKSIELPSYELRIPINHEWEDDLTLCFYPNKMLEITFLTFEAFWRAFIETLRFDSIYNDREESVKEYRHLRNEYVPILKKLNVDKICIITDAYYEIESMTNIENYPNLSFIDILNNLKEKDKMTAFNFNDILNAKTESELDLEFIIKEDLEIMLIDEIKES